MYITILQWYAKPLSPWHLGNQLFTLFIYLRLCSSSEWSVIQQDVHHLGAESRPQLRATESVSALSQDLRWYTYVHTTLWKHCSMMSLICDNIFLNVLVMQKSESESPSLHCNQAYISMNSICRFNFYLPGTSQNLIFCLQDILSNMLR